MIRFSGAEGTQPGLCFFDVGADDLITRITDFWPELTARRCEVTGAVRLERGGLAGICGISGLGLRRWMAGLHALLCRGRARACDETYRVVAVRGCGTNEPPANRANLTERY